MPDANGELWSPHNPRWQPPPEMTQPTEPTEERRLFCRRGHPMQPGRTRCLICHPETPDDPGVCRICGRHEDTRDGVCFSCADNAERRIVGVDPAAPGEDQSVGVIWERPLPPTAAEDTPDPPAGSGWRREGNLWVTDLPNSWRAVRATWDDGVRHFHAGHRAGSDANCRICHPTEPWDDARIFQSRTPETLSATSVPLPPQLWVGGQRAHAPSQDHFSKPENDPGFGTKPKGGLWTSTFVPGKGSGWTDWSLSEDFHVPAGGWASWLLYPTSDVQVLRIDTYADLQAVVESEYGLPMPYRQDLGARCMNFPKLAERFDAIWLTDEGQWATRLSLPHTLYGWDCESVLWLNWSGIDWERTESLGSVRWGQPPEPAVKPRRLRGPRRRF